MELLRILLIPAAVGVGATRLMGLRFQTDRLAWFGWVWMSGTLTVAGVVFAWLWWGVPDAWALDAVCLGLAALGFLLGGKVAPLAPTPADPGPVTPRPWSQRSWEERAFPLAVALALAVTLLQILLASRFGIFRDDEAIYWSYHGKVIFHEGGFHADYQAAAKRSVQNADYPLFNPLLHVWSFIHAGRITHVVNRVPFQLFSLALVAILASALRRGCRPWIAACTVLLLVAMPQSVIFASTANSGLLVALGGLVMLDGYLRWNADGQRWLPLGALGAAFAVWSKLEGLLFFVAAIVPGGLWLLRERVRGRWRLRWVHLVLLAPLLVAALNSWFSSRFDLESPLTGEAGGQGVLGRFVTMMDERLPVVLAYFRDNVLLNTTHFGFAFLAGLLALVLARPAWRPPLWIPTVSLLLILAGDIAAFVGRTGNIDVHLKNGVQRVVFQCFPGLLLWLAFVGQRLLQERATRVVRIALFIAFGWFGAYSIYTLQGWAARNLTPGALREALFDSEQERLERRFTHFELLEGLPRSFYSSIYKALQERTPENARITAVAGEKRFYYFPLSSMGMVIYPRTINARRTLPRRELWTRRPDHFPLTVDESLNDEVSSFYALLASGDGWWLWH